MVQEFNLDRENRLFLLAEEFIHTTSRSLFLTGKAGTGKTTFLKHIHHTTSKNVVIVAPTGVAAINAGGVTIHSFFQLPFSPIVPPEGIKPGSRSLFERSALLRNLNVDSEKRNIFRELQLLIIDEVSMVRADVLDAIDIILRFFRNKEAVPFGGVQVLLIGDLYQLPPVTQPNDWIILSPYYRSPFFFDSYAWRYSQPLYIELKKVFRQTDPVFIEMLNRIRNAQVSTSDLDALNKRFDPLFEPDSDSGYITLTTHNSKADSINESRLRKLDAEEVMFQAEVEGDFPERSFPTDKLLVLKPGAQVMFIKNDISHERRYFNGKIGIVADVGVGKILVRFPEEERLLEVSRDSWRNVRYTFNSVTREVEEEVLGVFTQYPLRLAWAITIHKSQGLTFHNVVIDAGKSFAPGQVYVALSRCTSLEGIVLYSKINPGVIRCDERVREFAESEPSAEELDVLLGRDKMQYKVTQLLEIFDWSIGAEEIGKFRETIATRKSIDQTHADEILGKIEDVIAECQHVTTRFEVQLRALAAQDDWDALRGRVEAAVSFFVREIDERIINPLEEYDRHLKETTRVKKARKKLQDLIEVFKTLQRCFEGASGLAVAMWK